MDLNAIALERLVSRRSRDLRAATGAEILISLGAALFFVAVIVWRLPAALDLPVQAGLAAIFLWTIILLLHFRRVSATASAGALAAPALDHYRDVIQARRTHLRSAWIWHGPLLLSLALFLVAASRHVSQTAFHFSKALPFLVLLAVWVVYGIYRRYSQAADLEQELRELDQP